jgi:hypothetical protein
LAYPEQEYRKQVIERRKTFLRKAQETGEAVNTGEYNTTCKGASVKVCELYAQFIPNSLIIIFNDIPERKNVE